MRSQDPDLEPTSATALDPELEDAISAALLRLVNNFGVFIDEAAFTLQLNTWTGAAERNPWLTAELVDAALAMYLDRKTEKDSERKVPPVGDFIAACMDAKRQAEAARALPAPVVEPAAPNADVMARHAAVGRLRFRRRATLITSYRERNGLHKHFPVPEEVWRGQDDPTDDEVDAYLAARVKTPAA